MPSSASPRLRLELQATGEKVSIWGEDLNKVLLRIEEAIDDVVPLVITGDRTLTSNNYIADEARGAILSLTGTPAAPFMLTAPAVEKSYWVRNGTGQSGTLKTAAGVGAVIRAGRLTFVFCDGTDFYAADPTLDQIRAAAADLNLGGFKTTNQAPGTALTHGATLANSLDQFAAPVANLALAGFKITGSANATLGSQDLPPISQVVALINSATVNLPVQTGNAGRFLTTDGTNPSWNTTPLAIINGGTGAATATLARAALLPAYSGNALRFLQVNSGGTDVQFADVQTLPSQTGQSGKFLQTNGTSASWATAKRTLISTTTVSTAVASVAFTGLDTATYSAFEIEIDGMAVSASAVINLQYTPDGTTWRTINHASVFYNASGGTATGSTTSPFASSSNATTDLVHGLVRLSEAGDAARRTRSYTDIRTNNSNYLYLKGAQFYDSAEAHTGIRFIPSAGNISAGTFKLYGVP